jgi:UDP-N-acetylglucosamine 2-epimerase
LIFPAEADVGDNRPHILAFFGTRPEAIKMMPLVKTIRERPSLRLTVAVTGQHREMLDQVFRAFSAEPDINLQLMRQNQTLAGMTAEMIVKATEVVEATRPDAILVHGDTTTAMACAVAAFYARRRLGHVEAGLRSYDNQRPWPEEFNRVAIDAVADYLFAPTELARTNLEAERQGNAHIYVTGNTGIDSLLYLSERIDNDPALAGRLAARYAMLDDNRDLVLVTGHRRESFGEGLRHICEGLMRLVNGLDVQIVYPVHLNPNVRETVMREMGGHPRVHLLDPVEYPDMVYLMKRARLIVTDSGGIQEEAPALGKQVLVTRDVTERPEAVATGHVRLVGTDPDVLYREAECILNLPQEMAPAFPYGDGSAGVRIADILEKELHS